MQCKPPTHRVQTVGSGGCALLLPKSMQAPNLTQFLNSWKTSRKWGQFHNRVCLNGTVGSRLQILVGWPTGEAPLVEPLEHSATP